MTPEQIITAWGIAYLGAVWVCAPEVLKLFPKLGRRRWVIMLSPLVALGAGLIWIAHWLVEERG